MKNLLLEKPCLMGVWLLIWAKFRKMLNQLTGYDLMFEASRRDIVMPKHTKNSTIQAAFLRSRLSALNSLWARLTQTAQKEKQLALQGLKHTGLL